MPARTAWGSSVDGNTIEVTATPGSASRATAISRGAVSYAMLVE